MTRTGLGKVHVALQPYVLRNWLVGHGLVTATWPFVLSQVPGRWHVPNIRLPQRKSLEVDAANISCLHRAPRNWSSGLRIGLREQFWFATWAPGM